MLFQLICFCFYCSFWYQITTIGTHQILLNLSTLTILKPNIIVLQFGIWCCKRTKQIQLLLNRIEFDVSDVHITTALEGQVFL